MKNILGLLNLQERTNSIRELTRERPVGMLPFAGRYRLLDFALSSMVNSGIKDVGVLLPEKSRAALDHIRSGKDWDLARHHGGLIYLPPAKQDTHRDGDLKSMYFDLDYIEHIHADYVLIADGNYVYNMDFNPAVEYHEEKQADITLVYMTTPGNGKNGITLKLDEESRVLELAEKHTVKRDRSLFLGVAVMSRRLFIDLVRHGYERGDSDFLLDGVMRQVRSLRIYGFAHTGYAREVNSTESYYATSIDMFRPEVFREIFRRGDSVYTKEKDMPPTHFLKQARIKNSLIANGCEIAGEVENSIVFRGVKIKAGAKVRNSIIMQSGVIEENAVLENIICDKNVVVRQDKWLRGAEEYPMIIGKNIVI